MRNWMMSSTARFVSLSAALAIVAIGSPGPPGPVRADDSKGREVPAAFSPLEYLVGSWKGTATPKDSAQSFRGWPESHTWAWIFTKGKPTGLSLSIRGGKVLAGGKLTYDNAQRRYRLEATESKPGGGLIAFAGSLDASGKKLVLDQVGHDSGAGQPRGTIRLSIRPNANFIRYTMWVDRKDPGDVQFSPSIEVGLTKEGESLAAGASSSERPKCIVTGGAATMTLTYQGRTFQICCTGCRDEFNENPEKYIKKASLLAQTEGAKSKSGPSPARVSRTEDAFAADVDDAPAMKEKRPASGASPKTAKADPSPDPDVDGASKSSTKKSTEKSAPSQPSTRAAGLLQVGQNLERSGKSIAALGYYKRIVKDYPDTPAAKTAKQRIKAIDNP
jgi:YHS domain-containing protein